MNDWKKQGHAPGHDDRDQSWRGRNRSDDLAQYDESSVSRSRGYERERAPSERAPRDDDRSFEDRGRDRGLGAPGWGDRGAFDRDRGQELPRRMMDEHGMARAYRSPAERTSGEGHEGGRGGWAGHDAARQNDGWQRNGMSRSSESPWRESPSPQRQSRESPSRESQSSRGWSDPGRYTEEPRGSHAGYVQPGDRGQRDGAYPASGMSSFSAGSASPPSSMYGSGNFDDSYLGGASGQRARAGKPPKGYVRSDDRLKEEVCERLASHGRDWSDVEVQVSSGEVTLTGTVADRQHKFEAEHIADAVRGVTEVTNQLRIKGANGHTEAAKGEPTGNGHDESRRGRAAHR